ncbi:hypothetical protein Vretimale_2284 [Volvox reticuliferus]|nr:hypothetical protein Vretimale_2284 [Volvox reticuliferus]
MATAISHGHGSPVGTVAAASGSSAAAALPAITVSGLPAGTGGTTCPLGRERSSLTSLGGPPRKETSYASSTASKISIATLPLDTLEHIIDDFRAHQHHGAKQHANGGNRGGRGGGPPAVRISTTVAAGGGGGRASVRTWNPVAGGGGGTAAAGPIRRSHGNVGSISFNFAAKPTTPQGNGPGGVLPGVLVQPPVLPGLPPGAPLSLSSRAAAVLQVPESAAHLQRFIALDAAQLENHYVIAHPNGAAVTDLQEVIDNASSIDGLPSGREAVVVLTTTADGVPIPRIVPLDQPLPGSLRRSGMGHTRGASATGVSMVDALLLDGAVRSSNSSASLLAAGQVLMVDIVPGYEGGGGGTEGDVVTPPNASTISFARAGSNPIFVPAPPLSPQRSMAALYSPRRGGTPPARRSDNGLPRGVPYPANVRVSSVTMMGPGQPSSPPLRSTAGVAMQGNNLQINTLPALGDGSAAAAGARRSAPRRRGSASALIRREASSDAVAQSLPVLVRTISPDRSNLAAALVTADGGFNSLDGGVESMGASPINSGPVHPGGGGAGVSTRPRSGAVDGHQDLSPTRSRLHARIVTLQTERSSHQLLQPTQAQRQTSPLQPRGGGRNGVGRSTITMSGLSGMELVRAALKQVETGERTLVDPLVRISSNGVSEGSRRASQSSVTTACSGHGSGVGGSSEAFQPGAGPIPVLDTAALAEEVAREEEEEREAAERRQARLVKSLTMLLTTGRSRGQVSRQSSAASRLSRNASLVLAQDANDADDEEDVGSADGSSTTGEDEDLQHRGGDGHSQQPSGDGSTSTSVQPPQPSRENSQQHLTASKSARGKHEHRRYNRFRSRLLAGSRQASEISLVGARSRSVRSSRGSDNGSDTLEAAAAIAADGGLDPQALVEFAQQLDQANEEFRLVESPRLDLITPRPPVRRHASFPRCGRRREVVSEGEREEKHVFQRKDGDGKYKEHEAEFFGLHLFPRQQPSAAFPWVRTAGFPSAYLGFLIRI